jgi:Zn-dependent protease with chaperone function
MLRDFQMNDKPQENKSKEKQPVITYDGSIERLSEKNYPDYAKEIQTVRLAYEAKYPNETFPQVYIISAKENNAFYYSDPNALGNNKVEIDGKTITLPLSGVEKEGVFITKGLVEKLTPKEAAAAISHEFAHDALNHPIKKQLWNKIIDTAAIKGKETNPSFDTQATDFSQKISKELESQADLLAVSVFSTPQERKNAAEAMINTLKKVADPTNPSPYHPLIQNRINAMKQFSLNPKEMSTAEIIEKSQTPNMTENTQQKTR